jgi:hypothetical protein
MHTADFYLLTATDPACCSVQDLLLQLLLLLTLHHGAHES